MRVHRARWAPLLLALTVGACRAGGAPSAPAASGATVSGHVVDRNLRPLAGVSVRIGGATATTGPDGHFAITGATRPYDVFLVEQDRKTVTEYRGLTRLDPTLTIPTSSPAPDSTGTVTGHLSGGAGFPQPSSHRSGVAFESQLAGVQVTGNVAASTGTYGVQAGWSTMGALTGTVHALQWEAQAGAWPSSSIPVAYSGYGYAAGQEIQPGTTVDGSNIALRAVNTSTLHAEFLVPAGWTILGKYAYAVWPSSGAIEIAFDPSPPATVAYATPDAGGQIALAAWIAPVAAGGATGDVWAYRTLAPDAAGVVIPAPVPPQQLAPSLAATDPITIGDEFVWTPFEDGVTVFLLAGAIRYTLVTKGSSATLPDVSAWGLELTPGAYAWQVEGYAPYGTVDAAAGPAGFYRPWPINMGRAGDGAAARSYSRGVTIQ